MAEDVRCFMKRYKEAKKFPTSLVMNRMDGVWSEHVAHYTSQARRHIKSTSVHYDKRNHKVLCSNDDMLLDLFWIIKRKMLCHNIVFYGVAPLTVEREIIYEEAISEWILAQEE